MTLYTIPSGLKVVDSDFAPTYNTRIFASPINTVQREELSGARWIAKYVLAPMDKAGARSIKAFLASLNGRVNTFSAYDPTHRTNAGSASVTPGVPLVNGVSQTGTELIVDGMPNNATGYLLAGDYFSVNNEFKMIIEDVNTNGSGQATFKFRTKLRASPANNAAVNVTNPTCEMFLSSDVNSWPADKFNIYGGITFTGEELIIP